MPVHDWKPVDANLFHHFHQRWTIAISDALNAGQLPTGYSALVEQRAAGLEPDVLAVQRRSRGDGGRQPKGGVLTTSPPQVRFVFDSKEGLLAPRGNRVAIRHRLGDVVCIIEIVSPGNKASRHGMRSFLKKSLEFLESGVNLLVIDLFPPTKRDPRGIHNALWKAVGDSTFEPPTDKPLTLAAYVAGDALAGVSARAYVEPIGVGDVLPDMPAFLDFEGHVPVPLEATYQLAWATCPEDMRILVETGRLPDEPE